MMNNQFLVICNAYPKKFDSYYMSLSGCDTTTSSVIYSNAVIRGLGLNNYPYNVISAASIGHYPFTSKTKKLKDQKYDEHYFGVGYSNVIGISQIDKSRRIYEKAKTLNYNKNVSLNILVTDVHAPFIKAALKIRKKYKNSRIVLICLDLPQYVKSSSRNFILKILKKISIQQVTKLSKKADGYIYLSDYMCNQFGTKNKPFDVIESILDTSIYDGILKKPVKGTTFAYCGVLSKQYNVDFLLKSFSLLKNNDYQLILVGKGDMVEEIQKQSSIDSRIKYYGELPREEAYKIQLNASVLVNPRLPTSEYTKVSFPSKTVSYLYSGNPFVCFALPSFPEKIKNNIVCPKDVTCEAFAFAMEEAIGLKFSKQIDVAKEYSEKNVTYRINQLFERIRNNERK